MGISKQLKAGGEHKSLEISETDGKQEATEGGTMALKRQLEFAMLATNPVLRSSQFLSKHIALL